MPNRETPYERSVIRATEAALAYIAPALRATRADYIRIMEWRMALDGFVPTGMSGRTVTTGGVQRAVTGRAVYLPPAEWRRWLDRDGDGARDQRGGAIGRRCFRFGDRDRGLGRISPSQLDPSAPRGPRSCDG